MTNGDVNLVFDFVELGDLTLPAMLNALQEDGELENSTKCPVFHL